MGKHTLDPMVVNGTVIPGEDEDHFKENVPDVQKVILECLSLKKLALSHDGVCVMAGGQDGEREQGGEAERSDGMTDEESAVSEDSTDGRCDNDGVGHITLKSFICTGVDIEIPDNTRFSEDTVILLAEDHAAENHWSSALESENLGNFEDFILSSNSMKHEDHNYGQVEKFMINAESSQLGFEPLPDLNESEANAPENRVEISSENPSEFPSENLGDVAHDYELERDSYCQEGSTQSFPSLCGVSEPSCTVEAVGPDGGPEVLSNQCSIILDTSMPQVSLIVPSSPLLHSSRWHRSEEEAAVQSVVAALSSTPVMRPTSPADLSARLPNGSLEISVAQSISDEPSDKCPLVKKSVSMDSTSKHSDETSADLMRSMLSIPMTPKMQTSLIQNVCPKEMNQDFDAPQQAEVECHQKGGEPTLNPACMEPAPKTPERQEILLGGRASSLWTEKFESPMPSPQHNSTELSSPPSCGSAQPSEGNNAAQSVAPLHLPLAQSEPLQQQLLKMMELLILKSGGSTSHQHVAVGTSPVHQNERSVNTSGLFELKREISVAEASTSTDSLLWTLTPGSLESASREELQQRLTSLLIMVEVLSQQLSSVRGHKQSAGPGPSELREKLVQTDHTELNQVGPQDMLYEKALEKIHHLELDHETMGNLLDSVKDTRAAMVRDLSVSLELNNLGLSPQIQAFSVMEQLRVQHAIQVARLEENVGSHVTLKGALSKAHLEQVFLWAAFSVNQHGLILLLQLCKARCLLQRSNPLVLKVHEKMAVALGEAKKREEERKQAVEEKNKVEFPFVETQLSPTGCPVFLCAPEIGVLRQQLGEAEEERTQLHMKNTELSATVSSIQASYAFLQQALADETRKLQQSSEEAREATERVHSLEAELKESCWQLEEQAHMLAEREQMLTELRSQAQVHIQQLEQLHEVQEQLAALKEMNEYLQAENELSQEQVAESEGLLKSHLQGLRERNLECEDLKRLLSELRQERECLLEELDSTRSKARAMLLDMGEQLSQASVDVAVLHHRVHGLTSALQSALHPEVGPSALLPPCIREERSNVVELLSGLGDALSELISTITQLREVKDTEQRELEHTVCSLRGELQVLTIKHSSEVADLRVQMQRLQARVDKDAEVLQHKAQEERTLKKLCSELDQSRELLQQYRSENSDLRRELTGLRHSLQQAELEAQVLREELSTTGAHSELETLNERLELRKEVAKLKRNLMEVEDSRGKLLERAKRHQLVHETNQKKSERELHLLDKMIDTVRQTLSSIPAVVQNCEELQKLVTYLG
uniref:Si:dkey-25o16.4 n=1 Tax=Scleropages formosus TaxID=113540 RepID=A0A8C9S266_SCLFO